MKRLFVYGTLKRGHGNSSLLSDSRFIGASFIKGFKMVSMGGFPAIYKANPDDIVQGEVYEVDDDAMRYIDALEGYHDKDNHWYDRVPVDTFYGTALVYTQTPEECEDRPVIGEGIW